MKLVRHASHTFKSRAQQELEKVMRDIATTGYGFMLDGKRVPIEEVMDREQVTTVGVVNPDDRLCDK